MKWFTSEQFEQKKHVLQERARIIKAMRRFFDDAGFTEVDTPILQVCPTFDTHIHGFETVYRDLRSGESETLYLQTSPELDMKKLLVAGAGDIYQICKTFRNSEKTRQHLPEFMMIEWYRTGADYNAIMQDCMDLLRSLGVERFCSGDSTCDPHADWEIITVREAFLKFCGIDLDENWDLEDFKAAAVSIGVRVTEQDAWDDVFHAIMASMIEPHLGQGAPTILKDYPLSMAALSRPIPGNPAYAERFELYVCGVELANAFSELTDVQEQKDRFIRDMKDKERLYGRSYPVDGDFFEALELGLPDCAGIALGIDRLVMLACGVDDINDVQWCEKFNRES